MSYSEDLIKDLTTKTDSRSADAAFSYVAHGVIVGTSVIIVAASISTKGVIITNATNGILYIKLGGETVTSTSYSVAIASGGLWEAPYYFQGAISARLENGATGDTFITIVK